MTRIGARIPLAVHDRVLGRDVVAPVALASESERCYRKPHAGPKSICSDLDRANAPLAGSLAGRGEVDVWVGVEGRMSNRVRIHLAGGVTSP